MRLVLLVDNYVCWCTMPWISVTVCLCFIAVEHCIMYCCNLWSALSQRQGTIEMSKLLLLIIIIINTVTTYIHNHVVRSASSAITEFGINFLFWKVLEGQINTNTVILILIIVITDFNPGFFACVFFTQNFQQTAFQSQLEIRIDFRLQMPEMA